MRDLVAMAGPLGRLENRLAGVVGRAEVGSEAALVADARREAALLEQRLQRVIALDADPERLGERRRAGRDEHELLEVERVLRVGAAVDDVHHRHGQHVRVRAAEPAVQRQVGVRGRCLGDGERDAEDRVRAEPRLRRRAVELDHGAVDLALLARVHPGDAVGDLAVDVGDGAGDALAEPGVAAVAELDRLVLAGRCAGGHGGCTERARLEPDLDLDGRDCHASRAPGGRGHGRSRSRGQPSLGGAKRS